MNHSGRSLFRLSLLFALVSLTPAVAHADQQWTPPTPEELSMTSQPQVPGASAVYLNRDETTDDKLRMFSIYVRLKVLNERGKEFGNVELHFAEGRGGGGFTIDSIEGRTIHPDGTIIPFTGKPYEKLVEKTQGIKIMSKVFSMPDVTVGSILEYRYKLRYDDMYVEAPSWYVQSDLWTRKAHYLWRPIDLSSGWTNVTNSRGQSTNIIAWTTVLPNGESVAQTKVPGTEQSIMELNMHDIPPEPEEEYMPPLSSFTFRVLFYFTAYRSADEFWKNEGKFWAKNQDKFIGPGPIITAAAKDIVSPSDTPDQKLRKLYAAVMKLENTRFTRQHSNAEEKAEGFKEVRTADDIWTRKRGTDDQITGVFVSLARAAGFKAYLGRITSRDRSIFTKTLPSFSQFDDSIAIVNIDGKDQFFDPGARFCPYGHLSWAHTVAQGIRQTESGSDFFATSGESYTFSRVQRIADLNLTPEGALSGTIRMIYSGDPALRWRHRSLEGDSASLEREIRTSVERLVPTGVEVKVASIDKLEDYEEPLVANLEVKGSLGSSTGKRILLPGDIFEANAKPAFPHEKREIPVYFEFTRITQDAVRVTFPSTLSVESLPASNKESYEKAVAYSYSSESTPRTFTVRRTYALGDLLFDVKQYPALRSFYSKMETKDQENVVLTTAPATAAKSTPTGN
jgi:Domain of Unknown Function with PDB structure (DUF3857)/Transglutaminase-like superfamily